MTNASIIVIYCTAIALVGALLIFSLRARKGLDVRAYYAILTVCLLLWLIPNTLCYIVPIEYASLANELKFIGCALSPVALLLFTMRYLHMGKLLNLNTILLLSIIPVITAILAVTNPLHFLFRQQIAVIDSNPRYIERVQGIWFWVHTGYSYLLSMLTVALVVSRLRKTAGPYRLPLVILLVGILLSLSGNLVTLFLLPGSPLDFTLLGFSLAMIFLYWSMEHSQLNDFLALARDEIFQTMRDAVFILDEEYSLLLFNAAASDLCQAVAIPLSNGDSFDGFMQRIVAAGGRITENRWGENMDVTIPLPGAIRTYSIEEHPFTDFYQNHIGSYIALRDVTEIRSLIQRLEETAGVDALTGIPNRLSYEEGLTAFDRPEFLPFSIVMGDLNNLKETNDTLGHNAGDELLRAIASLLLGCLPEQGTLFRIGGDEFAILLPNTPLAETEALIQRIRRRVEDANRQPYDLSIALGGACRETMEQEIRQVIAQADKRMYLDKETIK